jgi:hypothetical protein
MSSPLTGDETPGSLNLFFYVSFPRTVFNYSYQCFPGICDSLCHDHYSMVSRCGPLPHYLPPLPPTSFLLLVRVTLGNGHPLHVLCTESILWSPKRISRSLPTSSPSCHPFLGRPWHSLCHDNYFIVSKSAHSQEADTSTPQLFSFLSPCPGTTLAFSLS